MSDTVEKIKALAKAYEGDRVGLLNITRVVNNYAQYVACMVSEAVAMIADKPECYNSIQDYQDNRMQRDRQKHNVHESIIVGTNTLNRMCELKGLPPFFEGNISDRYEIADFAMLVTCDFYVEDKRIRDNIRENPRDAFDKEENVVYIDREKFAKNTDNLVELGENIAREDGMEI